MIGQRTTIAAKEPSVTIETEATPIDPVLLAETTVAIGVANRDVILRMIAEYCIDGAAAIRSAVEAGRGDRMASAAHALRGAVAPVGAVRFTRLLLALEHATVPPSREELKALDREAGLLAAAALDIADGPIGRM